MNAIELSKLHEAIEAIRAIVANPPAYKVPAESRELAELYSALAKAQGEFQAAGKRSDNPYFKSKYADITECVRVSRPALTKNGLSVIQNIIPNEEGHLMLITRLGHSSGQWIESRIRIMPPKNDIQSLGSHITYLRRYAYAALVGVVTINEDDDGEMSMAFERVIPAEAPAKPQPVYQLRDEAPEVITRDQFEQLEYELADYPDIAKTVLDGLKILNLADMPKHKFLPTLTRIREIKQLRETTKK